MWIFANGVYEYLLKVINSEYTDVKTGDHIKVVMYLDDDGCEHYGYYLYDKNMKLINQKGWDIYNIHKDNVVEAINNYFERMKVKSCSTYKVDLI